MHFFDFLFGKKKVEAQRDGQPRPWPQPGGIKAGIGRVYGGYAAPVGIGNAVKGVALSDGVYNAAEQQRFQRRPDEVTYVGIRYHATGVFGYSFRNGEKEVFTISSLVLPNPDVFMRGFNKEFVHEHYDEEITLVPGVRRTIVDQYGQMQCYYEYVEMNEYRIITKRVVASVKVFENGWKIYQGETQVADILRIPKMERIRFEENGYDMEKYFLINISKKAASELYPYIMSVPMLGF